MFVMIQKRCSSDRHTIDSRTSRIVVMLAAGTIATPRMAPRATLVAVPSLRYWRTQLAVPQSELASMARMSTLTVQRLEAGGTARLSTVKRLAIALEITPAQLMAAPPEPQS